MKRDWDLIRALMLKSESLEFGGKIAEAFEIWDGPTVREHIRLLHEKGYIEAALVIHGHEVARVVFKRVTWEGHDLIAAMRNETVWRKVTGQVQRTAGEVTIDVLKSLLQESLTAMIRAAATS